MSEMSETTTHEAATIPPPPDVDDVLHALHALGVAVPHEAEIGAYLHQHTDVLPVVRAAGERLRTPAARARRARSNSTATRRSPRAPSRSPCGGTAIN